MRALFISDAHLRLPQDKNYQLLLTFLKRQKQLDALFLLGDIFEFWYGYDSCVFSHYLPLLDELRRLSQNGTKIYFVEGNHDFCMGSWFRDYLNCTLISEQQLVEFDGQTIFICHGDLLKSDPAYSRLRAFWRSRLIRGLAKIIPPTLTWRFALWLSNKSSHHNGTRISQDPTPHISTWLANHPQPQADIFVSGHFHYPVVAYHGAIKCIALGDWIRQFSYAELIDGQISLKSFVFTR